MENRYMLSLAEQLETEATASAELPNRIGDSDIPVMREAAAFLRRMAKSPSIRVLDQRGYEIEMMCRKLCVLVGMSPERWQQFEEHIAPFWDKAAASKE